MPQSEIAIVSGAAGFIGSHLSAALLQRGMRVVGIDNFDPFYSASLKRSNVQQLSANDRFTFVEADICDAPQMSKIFQKAHPTCVFHLAALAGVRPSIANPMRYATVNVGGLVSILDAARNSNCAKIVFASSSSVYGDNSKVPFAETDPVDEPISPYAATKRAGELVCHTYAQLFRMQIAAIRFFTVYGPAQRPDLAINTFMRLIADEEEVPMFGDGTTSRDYTFIDDIIRGVISACGVLEQHTDSFCRIYNLGSDHPIQLCEMIDCIAKVVGKPARIKAMPMQAGDVQRTWADITRARAELGYAPATKFADGLKLQWKWLSANRHANLR